MLNNENAKELREKYHYKEDETLGVDKVGAYLFDEQTIKTFKITPDDGIYVTTFDQEIIDLNKTNDDIYYTLQELQDE